MTLPMPEGSEAEKGMEDDSPLGYPEQSLLDEESESMSP